MPPTHPTPFAFRPQRGVVVLAVIVLLAALGFGANLRVAQADNAHTTCVFHGFISGASDTDGSFFSRVNNGCSSNWRQCAIYSFGVLRGYETVGDSSTICSAWSNSYGSYTECAGAAWVSDPGVFSDHSHGAPNPC
jgi:hypothetical protein